MSSARTSILFPLVLLLLFSCGRKSPLPATMEAHHLVYQVNYLDERAGDIPTRILPNTMDAYYSKDFICTNIEGFFNQFRLTQVADLRSKRVTTMLNFFGNKVYYVADPGDLPAGIADPGKLDFTYTGDRREIGNLSSERILVRSAQDSFSIYATDEFQVRRVNTGTPYRSIDNPLSDFRVQLSYLNMHLTCDTYEFKSVETDIFLVPEDYKPVSRTAMEEIINSLFTKD